MRPDRARLIKHEPNWTAMTITIGKWTAEFVLIPVSLAAMPLLASSLSVAATPADPQLSADEICMPKATYPTTDGGTTVFSHDMTCFTRPVTNTFP
jgi:hypothetical protein